MLIIAMNRVLITYIIMSSWTLSWTLSVKATDSKSVSSFNHFLLGHTTKEHSQRLVTLETCDQGDEETWPDQFQIFIKFSEFWKIVRFSENVQIFGKCSDFRKIFRFFGKFSDFRKIFRFLRKKFRFTKNLDFLIFF